VDVHISLEGRGDLAAGIYRQLLEAVLDGRLRAGEQLPPTRELARRLAVSRNTVATAYERLTAEGFLTTRTGAGTFVCTDALHRLRPDPGSRRAPRGGAVRPRRLWREMPGPAPLSAEPATFDFSVGVPDRRLFPFEAWRRLVNRELRLGATRSAEYGEPAGHAGLRAALARHIGVSRSVRADAADIVVTHGAQQAIDLIGRVLIEPGALVAVEDPGYVAARLAFRALGAKVVGVPVDDEGLQVARIPAGARLVYVTPSHQYPLGPPMSLRRRTALLTWAGQHGAVVVEDDYDSEFRFSDRPLEPLQSLDRHGRVVYVGSLSKTLLPMLRLGFLVAPSALQPALRTAKQLTDWYGELPTQAALAQFIDEGLLARHIRRATREYGQRRDRLVAAVTGQLGEWVSIVDSSAGLHVCAKLRPEVAVDMDRVMRTAGSAGVAMRSLRDYCLDGPPLEGLVLGFGVIPTERIDEGVARVATALQAGAAGSAGSAQRRRRDT
jgi:GntR family transcriptional regulator/MocR family aminotransferase